MKKNNVSRRDFSKSLAAAGVGTILLPKEVLATHHKKVAINNNEYDYIIVGSGAGGGPLAVNLVKHGFSVLVLEAGSKDIKTDNYNVPAFHAFASEDPALSWSYFVKHYSGDRDKLDSKYVKNEGILYPRGATIGGSTAVNAMITVYPHASDFEYLAKLTGDNSWSPKAMRKYLAYLENCQYLYTNQAIEQQHGIGGWLPTNYYKFDLGTLLRNTVLLGVIKANLAHNKSNLAEYLFDSPKFDVNNLYFQDGGVGAIKVPQNMGTNSMRHAVREHLLETQRQYPDKLFIQTDALVSKVLFDEDKNAIGVSYLEGKNLYKADPLHSKNSTYVKKIVKAKREVILSAGAFNTPQILQLSGIGDSEHLKEKNINLIHHLPGVGKNLQDRYELGITYKLTDKIADACAFGVGDDFCLNNFYNTGKGVYTTNGTVAANIYKSNEKLKNPDIFNFCLASVFKGYYPRYSEGLKNNRDQVTWAILKGHTTNNLGEIKLKDTDPTNTPYINFKYFKDGKNFNDSDMKALVKAVKNIRNLMQNDNVKSKVLTEVWPSNKYSSDEELKDFIAKETWGHHASCTCKIGDDKDPQAVLDTNFKVRGVNKLRVVDASVFPKIPGFFIAVPIYLISEKASDAILFDAGVRRYENRFKQRLQQYTVNKQEDRYNSVQVKTYPNPCKEFLYFYIVYPNQVKNCVITILNINSEVVFHKTVTIQKKITINIQDFKKGLYVYIIDFGIKMEKGKFMKQ